jgi:hypothetical protein
MRFFLPTLSFVFVEYFELFPLGNFFFALFLKVLYRSYFFTDVFFYLFV